MRRTLAILGILVALATIPALVYAGGSLPPTPIATTSVPGKMKCDGTTTTCAADGTVTATAGGTAGINQLTGDVTAGPAAGSAAATVVSVGGKALALGGALTTTGTGAITFALGNSAATLTFQGTDTYVGRATTDTLTNKTLTSPTINGAALSGTLSGNPTFSGSAPLFTGLSAGTQVSCMGLDAGNHLVLNAAACGSGGGGGVTSVGLSVPATSILGVTGSPVTSSGTLGLTTTGTSGGVPYFSSGTQLSSSAALTANLPVIGGGAGAAPSVGSRSGNTTTFATTTGTLTSAHCAQFDASGNVVDSGGACSGGTTTMTLAPGLASTSGTYNTGAQTAVNGSTIYTQFFATPKAVSYTVLATDTARLLYATAGSVTFTAPNPGVSNQPTFGFGTDGSHGYTLATVGGTAIFYGSPSCTGGTTAVVPAGNGVQIFDDGTNYQCSENTPVKAATSAALGTTKLYNSPMSAGWLSGANPDQGIIVAKTQQALTITAIEANATALAGGTATIDIYDIASGTATCQSGTKVTTSSFNANTSAGTPQDLLSSPYALVAGHSLCIRASAWPGSPTSNATITAYGAPS